MLVMLPLAICNQHIIYLYLLSILHYYNPDENVHTYLSLSVMHCNSNKLQLFSNIKHTAIFLILPLAYMLEKSFSVRLKCASPPVLSQDSRFLLARSLKELPILPLSSRLLFFCKNPKRLQEAEESAGWLHSPYMLTAAAC